MFINGKILSADEVFFIWQSYGIKVGYGGIPGPSGGRDASASQGGGCCSWKSSFSEMTHIPLFVHLCLYRIWCCFTCGMCHLSINGISNLWKISTIITWILVNIGCVYTWIFFPIAWILTASDEAFLSQKRDRRFMWPSLLGIHTVDPPTRLTETFCHCGIMVCLKLDLWFELYLSWCYRVKTSSVRYNTV